MRMRARQGKSLGLTRETNKIEWRALVDEDSLVYRAG